MSELSPPKSGALVKAIGAAYGAFAVALTLLQWDLLWHEKTTLEAREGWFWNFTPWPAASDLALWTSLALGLGLLIAWSLRRRPALAVIGLILLGVTAQHGLSAMDGTGLEAMRRNMTHTGHQTFVTAAVGVDGDVSWVADYEGTLSRYDRLGRMAKSKPPGTSLLYVATERAANAGRWDAAYLDRKAAMVEFAIWAWPFASLLVLIPLVVLATRFSSGAAGLVVAALVLTVPSLQLITMHVDQAFLPTLACLPVLVTLTAVWRGSFGGCLAAGLVAYLALFVSFSVLGALVLVAFGSFGLVTTSSGSRSRRALDLVFAGVGVSLGLLAGHLGALWFLDYDAFTRFDRAMLFHRSFKQWDARVGPTLYYAVLNTVEWIHWVGIPLVALWLVSAARAVATPLRAGPIPMLSLGLLVTLVATALTGGTEGETARLWLWFVPFAALGAGHTLAQMPPRRRAVLVPMVLAAQWVTVVLLKLRQDFQ